MRIYRRESYRNNLDAIIEYISLDNPRAALEVWNEIERHVEQLGQHPKLGRVGRVKNTRELIIAGLPYIVVYIVANGAIEVVRVLHGAQQWPKEV